MDYSIVVPAFNEECFLPTTLRHLVAAMGALPGRGELIVVDNNSADRTAEVARQAGARVVAEPVNQISRARNAGARAAAGRFLVFVDADTIASRALIERALGALDTGRVVGGGATILMDRHLRPGHRLILRLWNGLSRTFRLAAGSFLFCRRDAFAGVGGFSEEVFAGEELLFSRALKRWGKRRRLRFTILTGHPVITSARKLDWFGGPQLLATVLLFALFPFAIRSRGLCGLWYRRPTGSGGVAAHPSPADRWARH